MEAKNKEIGVVNWVGDGIVNVDGIDHACYGEIVIFDCGVKGMVQDERTLGTLSKKEVSQVALTFCDEIRKAGYTPMLYMNLNWYNNFVDWSVLENSGIDVWIACYGDHISAPSTKSYKYTIWQSTDGDGAKGLLSTKNLIRGIPRWNNVDVNFGFVDYSSRIVPRWEPLPYTEHRSTYVPTLPRRLMWHW